MDRGGTVTQGNPWLAAARAHTDESVEVQPSSREQRDSPALPLDEALDEPQTSTGLTGPSGPQPLVVAPLRLLPIREQPERPALWLVGSHGGAGETTLASIEDTWRAADHAWPSLTAGDRASCLLLARTSVRGLYAAQAALTQWAASAAGPSVDLLGLVLIADAPGRLPRPVTDLCTVVAGGAPRTWHLPWNEDWRLDRPAEGRPPRAIARLTAALQTLTAPPE